MTMTENGAGPDRDQVRELTPAEHRALAEADMATMRRHGHPGSDLYRGLALSALAHLLAAVVPYLEPPPAPQIPGLPDGWSLKLLRGRGGAGRWGYVVTDPDDRSWTPAKFTWGEPHTALAAGVRRAREIAGLNGGD